MKSKFPLLKICIFLLGLAPLMAQLIEFPQVKDFTADSELVPFQDGKLYGYMDRNHVIKIPPKYEAASFFDKDGFALIREYGNEGIIDKAGNSVVPTIARNISLHNPSLARITDGNFNEIKLRHIKSVHNYNSQEYLFYKFDPASRKYLVSKTYKVNQSPFDAQISYYSKSSVEGYFYLGALRTVDESGKVNFIDTSFQQILAQDIIDGEPLGGGLFAEYNAAGKCRIISQNGKPISDFIYDDLQYSGKEGYIIVSQKDEGAYTVRNGLVNTKHETIIDLNYGSIRYLTKNYFKINLSGLIGVFDLDNGFIIPHEYSSMNVHGEDHFIVENDDGHFIINKTNEKIAGPFTLVFGTFGKPYSIVKFDEEIIVINYKGDKLFTVGETDRVHRYTDDYIILVKDSKDFYLKDHKGKDIIQGPLRQITQTDFGARLMVRDGTQYGIYNGATKKWEFELDQQEIVNRTMAVHGVSELVITSQTEMKKITGTWENQKIEQIKPRRNSFTSSSTIIGEIKETRLPDNRMFSYDKKRDVQFSYAGDQLHIMEKVANRKRVILNEKLNQVSPANYYYDGFAVLNNEKYYVFEDDAKSKGLLDYKGKWKIKPATGQNFRSHFNICIVQNGSNIKLYGEGIKPISSKTYIKTESKGEFLAAQLELDKGIDIYNKNGELISENEYTNIISANSYYLNVSNIRNLNLETFVLDSTGNLKHTFPYTSAKPINEEFKYFIAQDLHDYGVLDAMGNPIIDFKYNAIGWQEKLNVFSLQKHDYNYDWVDLNMKSVIKDCKGCFKIHEAEQGSYIRGDEEWVYFLNDGSLVNRFPITLGSTGFSDEYIKLKLVKFRKESLIYFVDLMTGKAYQN